MKKNTSNNHRSQVCEFPKKERLAIYNRDKNRCIFCGATSSLTIAHVFFSRAKGGLGVQENGVLACRDCHNKLDHGRPKEKLRYEKIAKEYLLEFYPFLLFHELRYKKGRGKYEFREKMIERENRQMIKYNVKSKDE